MYDAKSEEIGPGIYRFKAEIGEHRCLLKSNLGVRVAALIPWSLARLLSEGMLR